MTDFKQAILKEFDTLIAKERSATGNRFKAVAYVKVLNQIDRLGRIEKMSDLATVNGIGKGIRDRIIEIFNSDGHLQEAEDARLAEVKSQNKEASEKTLRLQRQKEAKAKWLVDYEKKLLDDPQPRNEKEQREWQKKRQQDAKVAWQKNQKQPPVAVEPVAAVAVAVDSYAVLTPAQAIELFKNVHGIGIVKAKSLVEVHKIMSIHALCKASVADAKLLNSTQKKGLRYYEEFLLRIPREEMKVHSKMLKSIMKKAYPTLELDIVGSYRRGEPSSGDIDVLIKLPSNKAIDFGKQVLTDIVKLMTTEGYVIDTLALGSKKFMGISKVGEHARRLDIMITPEEQYGFAIMYFTGSMKFNIGMRQIALNKGYSMNEHGLTPLRGIQPAPFLASEEAIFKFLGLQVIHPKKRADANILAKMGL